MPSTIATPVAVPKDKEQELKQELEQEFELDIRVSSVKVLPPSAIIITHSCPYVSGCPSACGCK